MKTTFPKVSAGLVVVALLAPVATVLSAPLSFSTDQDYVVGFHSFPALGPGDLYQGALVSFTDPVLGFAVVHAPDLDWLRGGALSDPNVRYVEPTHEVRAFFTPDDPLYGQQYGPQHVQAPTAWDTTRGSMMKNVCIVDTGVSYTHRDLEGRYLGGYDFFNADDDPWDDNDHGTHVTGIAAAEINNGVGTAGMANVGILAAKVLGAGGSGASWRVASGIRWCADNGGDVINLSLGATEGDQVLQDAVTYAWSQGSLLVAAAGNQGPCTECVNYPAKYDEVIAVTCTDPNDAQCSFSSDGPESELAAPGKDIRSSIPGNGDNSYATLSGTSMSSPHVAGAAALLWSRFPALANCQIRTMLRTTAHDLGDSGWDETYGFGLVDAAALLDAALAGEIPALDCDVNGGPVCSLVGPADDRIRGSADFEVFAANPGSTIASVELWSNGVHVADLAGDGQDTFTGAVDATAFAEGSRRFDARCTDNNGASTTRGRSYLVDNVADPSVAITNPQDGDTLAIQERVLVAAASNAPDSALKVEVRANRQPWRDITSNRDADGNYFYDFDALRAPKSSSIRARATDSAGQAVDVVTVQVVTPCNNGWSQFVEDCVCPRVLPYGYRCYVEGPL